MARRRRYYEEEPEEEYVELSEALEPYADEPWDDAQGDYVLPEDPYQNDGYAVEYSDEHEAVDHENRFRFAIGTFNLVSIVVGVLVILVLVAMLLTLVDWLRSDITHTALLMQSGLQ